MDLSRSCRTSTSRVRVAGIASLLLVATSAWNARAAETLRVEVEFFEGDRVEPVNRATVFASGRLVRIEQQRTGAGSGTPVFLYRGDEERLYSLSESARTYVVLEPRMLAAIGGSTRASRREIDAGLSPLAQDQQRAFGHLLGVAQIDPDRPGDSLVVARTGQVGEVAGMACRRVELRFGQRLMAHGCVADWATVGLTPADVEVFRSLAAAVGNAAGAHRGLPIELVPGQPLDLVVQFGGFPLFFERAGKAREASAIRVSSVERIAHDEARFAIPEGFVVRKGIAGLFQFASLLSSGSHARAASDPASSPSAPGPAALAMDGGDDEVATGSRVAPARPRSADAIQPERLPRHAARPYPAYRPIRLFEDAE